MRQAVHVLCRTTKQSEKRARLGAEKDATKTLGETISRAGQGPIGI
jgi:hypothetical protein